MTMLQFARAMAVALATAGASQYAFSQSAPKGQNCQWIDPPAAAGEWSSSTPDIKMVARIYPRLSDLPPHYTGCQMLWATLDNRPRRRSYVFIRDGRVESVYPPSEVPLCADGEKTAATGCKPRAQAVMISFPAGCTPRSTEGGKPPADCSIALQREFVLWKKLAE